MTVEVGESGLREDAREQLNKIGEADILLGIPTYENDQTVGHVVESVAEGVESHFPDRSAVVMVSDGDSEDNTRANARNATIPGSVQRVVTTYRGLAGKGSAFRALFEAGEILDIDYCLLVDGDLRTDLASWVDYHLTPLIEEGMDYQTPNYARHKFDGTITNNVCFPTTAALYGTKVRQPIGGDFAVSGDLVKYYAQQDEWETDVARFGIDIWMTTTAINEGFEIGQTNLGAKIHDPKDPGETLGPMFKEVVGTLFRMMDRYSDQWKQSKSIEDTPVFGPELDVDPEPVEVNRPGLREKALDGWNNHREDYLRFLSEEQFNTLKATMAETEGDRWTGRISANEWARILFDYAVAYNYQAEDPPEMIRTLIPLYFARTACLFDEMDGMTDEEAEQHIQSLVDVILEEKSYLVDVWPED